MKTLAIRLDDTQHAQLTVLAQLEGITVTDFIRQAIDAQMTAKRSQPELAAKAEEVLAGIDAEVASRREAIATLFAGDGKKEDAEEAKAPGRGRGRRPSGSA